MKFYITLFSIIFLFLGCASRPPAPPASHANILPWGAIDLDINSKDGYSIRHSLGSILTKKADKYSSIKGNVPFNILTLTGGGSRGAFGTGLIAAEYKNGRRLYIGTTNIDIGQLTVWDMGAIAASDREDKYQRFADIIYASAALPVYLPPQYIKVDINGRDYYQMHIDGGIYSQVFMIGLLVNWGEVLDFKESANRNFDVTLYTIGNRKYRQRDIYKPVKQEPMSIIEAYVLTEMDLLYDRSVYRLYSSCKKKGFKFKMASIPEGMKDIIKDPTEFHPPELKELFDIGYNIGNTHIEWKEKISFHEYDNNRYKVTK